MTETKYVAYLRVSTQKQGFSGLGLEAQREIIHNYLRDTTPISEYVEVESGRKSDRPKLKEALSQCRKESATLIVAKLDRLARSVYFLSNLLESDVEIIFCDFPQANKMVLHIISAISQYEAELIAARTKASLPYLEVYKLTIFFKSLGFISSSRRIAMRSTLTESMIL